jgi:uncharacterized protein (DUF2336 family)
MNSNHAALSKGLLVELQEAMASGNVAKRVDRLRRVTDLFVNAPLDYSDDQIALFDDVFQCLTEQIETSAKAMLANRLAPIAKAPPQLMRTLAFDDSLDVAAPVLSQSERLDDKALIENARTKSQGHLLAISKRKTLSGAVTDVLVERGNPEVVESAVNNPGAQFSESGFRMLVSKAGENDNLAVCLALRPAVPRHHYLKLIARASTTVRARLEASKSADTANVSSAVQQAAQLACAARSEESVRIQGLVQLLKDDGRLNEEQIGEFAEDGRFEETTAAIALLANISVSTVENMMIESKSEGVLVLAKVTGLSWETLEKILSMRRDLVQVDDATDIEEYHSNYDMLKVSTAQQVLRFYRMRQSTAESVPA